jgi:hypothetical protein
MGSMYYHAAVLLLFRPFLRATLTDSSLTPADLCRRAAVAISDHFARHMALYGTTGVYTFHLQGLLAACTIHLVNLPAISAAAALTAAAHSLAALVRRNAWAAAALRLVRALVRRWGIVVPGELEAALYAGGVEDAGAEPPLPPPRQQQQQQAARRRRAAKRPATATGAGGGVSSGDVMSDEGSGSRSGGGSAATAASATLAAAAAAVPKRQRLAAWAAAESSEDSDVDVDVEGPEGAPPQIRRQPSVGFLFAPFPSQQPAPLLGPVHTSTTPDPDLEGTEDEVRRVTRDFDGLRFEGDGWFDPFVGI